LKLLAQRVLGASIKIEDNLIVSIDQGVLVFVAIEKKDNIESCNKASNKLLSYNIFSDLHGRISKNIIEVDGEILLIPQVTLAMNTKKGIKPSFSEAADPQKGLHLFNTFFDLLLSEFKNVKSGVFGADMQVNLINDGPVTFLFEI
jgi:D-aminoacyl-tRNA deacylase|tara:strand:+ start:1081 stop:1518 length:438 start_codon:yes stop_codon:yes gene_type:complete